MGVIVVVIVWGFIDWCGFWYREVFVELWNFIYVSWEVNSGCFGFGCICVVVIIFIGIVNDWSL